MKECSLYKRVLQEGIGTKFYMDENNFDDSTQKKLFQMSGLILFGRTGSDENMPAREAVSVARMTTCNAIDMKQITEPWFKTKTDEIEGEFAKTRDECKEKGIENSIIRDIGMFAKEVVIPFDDFFIEIGEKNIYLQKDKPTNTQWGVYCRYIKFTDSEKDRGFLTSTVICAHPFSRPMIISIYPMFWNKKNQFTLTSFGSTKEALFSKARLLNSDTVTCLESMTLALNWLTAKNIRLQPVNWTLKEQKWSKKATGMPITKHYTLVVDLPSKSSGSNSTGTGMTTKALHLVRGHLSHYTAEKPLFGRLVGTFYIPAHTRGNDANGIITKDYRFKVR